MVRLTVVLLAIASVVAPPARPLIIAHRGASGYRPEHTLEAYRLAVSGPISSSPIWCRRRRRLVARHEGKSAAPDVTVRFPRRKRAKIVDGRGSPAGSEDFTLAN
jgi:glycerophosphoryl diester phosphodiesterase